MKLFACTKFTGHWAVGTAAVVLASTKAQAVQLLEDELTQIGLSQKIDESMLVQLSMSKASAIILRDGNY